MNRNMIWVVALVVTVLLVGGYLVAGSQPEVSSRGESLIEAKPDKISVYLSIETKDAELVDAQAENSDILNRAVDALIALGVDEDNIEFLNYNSYPWIEWNNGVSRDRGFVVYQQVIVNSKDFLEVPKIVDASVKSGALVQSIQFELSQEKQDEYKTEALKKASENAREKAKAIASGQGRSIGRLVSIQNQDYSYYPVAYYEAKSTSLDENAVEARSAVADIGGFNPRELEIRASIQAVYKLSLF